MATMHYDIVLKTFLEYSKFSFFKEIIGVEIKSGEILDELPQETVSVKRTDYPVLVKDKSGNELIYLIEFQTEWSKEKILDMVEYKVRYVKKFKKPVHSVYILLNPNPNSVDFYKDDEINFRFHLIKIWEIPAERFLENNDLLPIIPLLKNGITYARTVENRIYETTRFGEKKNTLDKLTIFGILMGLRDKNAVSDFFNRRRDIMYKSYMYDLIFQEGEIVGNQKGEARGILENKIETAKRMLVKGFSVEVISEITDLPVEEVRALTNG